MPADENARSGSILAGGTVSKKLYACCVYNPLFPPPVSREQRNLFPHDMPCPEPRLRFLLICHCIADGILQLLCQCRYQTLWLTYLPRARGQPSLLSFYLVTLLLLF